MSPHSLSASDILAIAAGFGAALILVNLFIALMLILEIREMKRDLEKWKREHEPA